MKSLFTTLALLLLAACTATHTESDSKSNWLRSCTTQMDCPTDAACVCGVCTKTCENADGCGGLSDATTICVNPGAQGVPACQSDPVTTGPNVCLLACQTKDECDLAQSCVQGLCVSAALVDASPGAPNGTPLDSGVQQSPPIKQGMDAGSTSVTSIDAGKGITHPTQPPTNDPDPDDDGGSLQACACNDVTVCSLDETCTNVGAKLLTDSLPGLTEIYAADADYVYGVDLNNSGQGQLLRWPTRGGDKQEMAGGMMFYFGRTRFENSPSNTSSTQPPLIVDDERLYFVAAADASELSNSLWSMPKDDSQMPTQHGYAGTVITQDADYVYFSNDGDSRVLRTGKTTLDTSDQREEIYRSAQDSPLTILLLAVNDASVFVTEIPPSAKDILTYTVTRVAKADSAKSVLGTNERFGTSPRSTFANHAYFVLGGHEGASRLDLATNEVKPLTQGYEWTWMSFANGVVFGASAGSGPGSFWAVDLATARRTLLASTAINVSSNVAVPGAVYATMSTGSFLPYALVRIAYKP